MKVIKLWKIAEVGISVCVDYSFLLVTSGYCECFECYSKPSGAGNALKLGGKKDVESFVDQLKSEGESEFHSQKHYLFNLMFQTDAG